jgi:membrane complex biogenesis BtpA family protein
MIDLPSRALIGMVHLPALPGSAGSLLPMDEIVERAVADARTLKAAGFHAVIVENFGDMPFPAEHLPSATIAALAVAADHVRRATGLPVGINALRNDPIAALGIAAAADASFIRVNVHTGVSATDQGMLSGRANETLRYRRELGKRIAILADVHVKHGRPISEPDIARAAKEAAYRGMADALVVSGPGTGEATALDDLRQVRAAVPDRRIFVGSGATAQTVGDLLSIATGVIVGSSLKPGGDASRPIDADLAAAFVEAAATSRSVGR